jgi:hypothetical protein
MGLDLQQGNAVRHFFLYDHLGLALCHSGAAPFAGASGNGESAGERAEALVPSGAIGQYTVFASGFDPLSHVPLES